MFDLDLILHNAKMYNGEEHLLTLDAKKLVEMMKRQIRGQLSNTVESEVKKQPHSQESDEESKQDNRVKEV